jgi:hypothetical protein
MDSDDAAKAALHVCHDAHQLVAVKLRKLLDVHYASNTDM